MQACRAPEWLRSLSGPLHNVSPALKRSLIRRLALPTAIARLVAPGQHRVAADAGLDVSPVFAPLWAGCGTTRALVHESASAVYGRREPAAK
jgi:hypothetical protein